MPSPQMDTSTSPPGFAAFHGQLRRPMNHSAGQGDGQAEVVSCPPTKRRRLEGDVGDFPRQRTAPIRNGSLACINQGERSGHSPNGSTAEDWFDTTNKNVQTGLNPPYANSESYCRRKGSILPANALKVIRPFISIRSGACTRNIARVSLLLTTAWKLTSNRLPSMRETTLSRP